MTRTSYLRGLCESRLTVVGVALAAVVGMVACGAAPQRRHLERGDGIGGGGSPITTGIDGAWNGQTSQQEPFRLSVVDAHIESFTLGFDSAGCGQDSPIEVRYGATRHAINAGSFCFDTTGLYRVTIKGELVPGDTATGVASVDLSSCGEGELRVTWTARKTGPVVQAAPAMRLPDIRIPTAMFQAADGSSHFDPVGTQVLSRGGDWFCVLVSMECALPVPSGWATEDTGKETLIWVQPH